MLDWWNNASTHDRWRSKADRDSKIIEAYCRIMNLPQPSITETSQTWCSHCERHFKYLKAHMKLHKSKPHQCNICKRLFAEPSQLDEHMRIYHLEEEKLFSCNNCGKGFPTKQRLKQHLKVHDKRSWTRRLCLSKFLWVILFFAINYGGTRWRAKRMNKWANM